MRTVLLILGSLFVVTAFLMIFGGWAMFLANSALTAGDAFPNSRLHTSSYALVLKQVNINIGDAAWWQPSHSDIVTIRLSASSNDPSKRVFIGVAPAADADAYLRDVLYAELINLQVSGDPFHGFSFTVEYRIHPGESPIWAPATRNFWTVSVKGYGTQTLEWSPRTGNYWIVFMNEDASAGVDLTVGVGAKVPLLAMMASGFLIGGVIVLVIGGVLLYFGIRRPSRVEAARTEPQPSAVVYCRSCGAANRPDSRFCRNCGAEFKP